MQTGQIMTSKIVVLGSGSVGTYIGGRLLDSSAQVTFVGRERLINGIQRAGLTIRDCFGYYKHHLAADVRVTGHEETLSTADIILVTVKSKDTEQAAKAIKTFAKPNAVVVSFQNGVRNAETLTSICNQQVLSGVVSFGAIWKEDATFQQTTGGDLFLESRDGLEQALQAYCDEVNFPISLSNDMKNIQWSKLVINMNNGINALTGVPLVKGLESKHYRRAIAKCMNEAISIINKAGIRLIPLNSTPVKLSPLILQLPTPLFKILAGAILRMDADARSSMLDDLEQGREPEVDYINGEIVRLAKSIGLSAPINERVIDLVKAAHKNRAGLPKISLENIDQVITP